MDNETKIPEQTNSVDSAASAGNQAVSSRRRILRTSLKATPVVLAALASRPSLACHCVMPSAWGSLNATFNKEMDINGQTGFQHSLARYNNGKEQYGFDPWGYNAFKGGSTEAWKAIADYYKTNASSGLSPDIRGFTFYDSGAKVAFAKGQQVYKKSVNRTTYIYSQQNKPNNCIQLDRLTVGTLLQSLGFAEASNRSYPSEIVGTHNFLASIMIAWVNLKIKKVVPSGCVTASTLTDMSRGTYQPQGQPQWVQEDIKEYLHYNWIARWGY